MPFFHGAHHFTISGSTMNEVAGDYIENVVTTNNNISPNVNSRIFNNIMASSLSADNNKTQTITTATTTTTTSGFGSFSIMDQNITFNNNMGKGDVKIPATIFGPNTNLIILSNLNVNKGNNIKAPSDEQQVTSDK